MSQEFLFRAANKTDAIAITPLIEQMAAEENAPYPGRENFGDDFRLWWITQFNQNPLFRCFVMSHGSMAKAFLYGQIYYRPIGTPKKVFLAQALYVEPGFRRKGIAGRLIKETVSMIKALGLEAIETSYVPGSAAHKMWSRAGFRSYQAIGVLVDENWKPVIAEPQIVFEKETK